MGDSEERTCQGALESYTKTPLQAERGDTAMRNDDRIRRESYHGRKITRSAVCRIYGVLGQELKVPLFIPTFSWTISAPPTHFQKCLSLIIT